jgi:hypothetical protein
MPVLLMVLIGVLPVAAVVALGIWATWLGRAAVAPRWARTVGYGLVCLAALPVAGGLALGVWAMLDTRTRMASEKAASLGMAISEAMNCGALGLLVAVAGALWLGFCTARWHRAARRRLVIGATVCALFLAAVVAGCVWLARQAVRDDPLREAIDMVQSIRVAQEAYGAETQQYANISSALAANQSTNHFALYPRELAHGRTAAWGTPCGTACAAGMEWSQLPIHVDGPVAFGYSTIAGPAGERPNAVVTIEGKRVEWPVPDKDWYIITAVGDVEGKGAFMTILATSWDPGMRLDPGGR